MLKKLKRFFKRSHLSLFVYVFSVWFVFMPVLGTAGQVKVANKVTEVTSQMGGIGNLNLDNPTDVKKVISQLIKQLGSMSPAELNRNLHKMVSELSKIYEQAVKQDKELYNAINTMKPTEFMDYITNRLLDTLNQADVEKAITEAQSTPITEEYVAQVNKVLKENNIKQRVTKKELEQMKEQVSHMDVNKFMDAIKQLNVELPNAINEIKSKYGAELDNKYATMSVAIEDMFKQLRNYKITKEDTDAVKDMLVNGVSKGEYPFVSAKEVAQMGGISAAMSTFFSRLVPSLIIGLPLTFIGAIMILGGLVICLGVVTAIIGLPIAFVGTIPFLIGISFLVSPIFQSIAAFFDTPTSGGGDGISIQFN